MPKDPKDPFQEYMAQEDEAGVYRLPQANAPMFDLSDEERMQSRLRLISFLQSVRAKILKEPDPPGVESRAMLQETVDLVCQGESEEAWLFHGPIGSPVEHLAIRKDTVPHRVAWVRVLLDLHVEKQGDTQMQGDTPMPPPP